MVSIRATTAILLWFALSSTAHGFPSPKPQSAAAAAKATTSGFVVVQAEPSSDTTSESTASSDHHTLPQLEQQLSQQQQYASSFDYQGRLPQGDANFRCGFVCILGAPNMGKSTLLNAVLQQDLCICTARPQTTRHAILGLLTTNSTQVCLVDTPGVIDNPAYKLQEGMMEAVSTAFRDANVLVVVTDVFSTPIPNDELFQRVQRSQKPTIVVVNKIDLAAAVANPSNSEANPGKLSVTAEQAVLVWRQLLPDAVAILPVQASAGPDDVGVVALRRLLCGGPDVSGALRALGRPIAGMFRTELLLPDGNSSSSNKSLLVLTDDEVRQILLPLSPPLYDMDALTDRTERFVASEIIRAALFQSLKKELPYCCEVQVTAFKEPVAGDKKPVIRIAATVIVERDSQKAIVIGKNGEQIKKVGMLAREKLQDFLQSQVFLDLSVKVNKDWRKKEDQLKAYGYLT